MGSASRATGGTGLKCSPLLLWNLALICLSLTRAETPVAGRRSRQASEAEPRGGVWGAWSPWTDCSQSCGPGVSERRRRCLPPPYVPLDWGLPAFLPPGLPNHTPVISAIRPDYPPPLSFPDPHPYGEQPPFYPQSALPSRNSGLPVFASDRGVAAHDRPGAGASLYRREFPSRGQELLPLYRPSAFPSPPRHYGPLGRSSPPPAGQRTATVRSGESRRSVPTSQDAAVPRRSSSPSASSIRPGQFGYGRVPFSLPLHRPSRNTRHAAHGGNSSSSSTPQLEEVVDQRELASAESDGDLQRAGMGEEGEKRAGEDDPARGGEEREETVAAGPTKAPAGAAGLADPEPAGKRHHEAPTGGLRQPERRRHPDRPPARPAEKHSSTRSSARVHRQADATHDLRYNRRTLPHHFPPHREALYSFSPALDHPPQLPPGPSNPGIWVVPPQHPGRGEADREAGPVGTSWGSHPHLGNFKCSGPEKEHRRCDVQLCPGGAVDPRAEQCSSFNDQEFLGRLYDWEPFTEVGPEQQCELTCRPAGFRFYVRQADVVRDGTPCANNTPGGVCVGGRCLNEGCDGVLGSGLVRDRCGVCGGRETSCRRVAGSFQNTSVPLGYHHILDIPLGATAINITERRASANYLALRSGTGQSVVNGRWAVDPPGEYRAGGTTFLYTRPRGGPEGQEEALGETLTAPGPTTTLLQLFIIHHRKNPGIDYEFYVPVEKEAERGAARGRDGVRAPLGETSALTVTAGDPVPVPPPPAERRWTAERSHPRGPASGRNARIPPRTDLPLDTQPPFVWRRGGLTECSASCGKGFQHRVVRCVNRHTEQDVSERKCDSAAKPGAEEIPCNLHPCPPL
ncbi:ADAMTS-like protein 4 [Arapaima gigas]